MNMASGRMREENGDASAYCGAEVLTDERAMARKPVRGRD
jgi:hypothetical protein